jgi:hypothetical protein
MKKVVIKKQNVITNQANFATQELADTWLAQEIANKSFGKPERWVSEDRIIAEGENINNAIETAVESVFGVDVNKYKFASEYVVEISDITSEIADLKKLSDRAKKRSFGESLIDKISTITDSKNLSIEEVDAFMSNSLITSLREHLWAGNISTFVSKLQSSDVSAFFSSQEKTAVIADCQAFLTSIGE